MVIRLALHRYDILAYCERPRDVSPPATTLNGLHCDFRVDFCAWGTSNEEGGSRAAGYDFNEALTQFAANAQPPASGGAGGGSTASVPEHAF